MNAKAKKAVKTDIICFDRFKIYYTVRKLCSPYSQPKTFRSDDFSPFFTYWK